MRDRLQQVHQGTEESLTAYGFDVVISVRSKKKTKDTIVAQIEVPLGLNGVFDYSEAIATGKTITSMDFEAVGSNGRFYGADSADGILPPEGPSLEWALLADYEYCQNLQWALSADVEHCQN
jgi:hypothetical protein